ncbi:MAG: family 16 glycosylhydrolase [Alteromonadaceae bacterium]|nr:family 16 glycosylhydrolase [Alteromonadaceae bacterium]
MKLTPFKYAKIAKYTAASLVCAFSSSALAQQCQTLIWADEFDASTLNTNAWDIQTGDGCAEGICGWGNSELQNYQADNITINNGVMSIEARKQRIRGTQYTSGRIRTANMPAGGEWSFGRFEARMKFPSGQGMWPAFWMLPTDPAQGWPMSGEIDIFEAVGQSSNFAHGTLHFGQPYPDNRNTGASMLKQPGKWSDDFHTYAIEWEQDEIRWYVDNMLYSVKTPSDLAPEDWPFDGRNNFHIILNLAVGGTWGGDVDDSVLPQTLEVDYVRVYGGNQPNLSGNHLPAPGSTETYTVLNDGGNTSWAVTGGTLSGTGSSVSITWDASSAGTTQTLTANSGGCEVSTQIYVGQSLSTETVLENFDGTANMSLTSANGVYDTTSNPGVLTYTRDGQSQYDVIAYSTSAIGDVAPYILGDKAFEVEVINTDAALVGKEILVQLENSAVATPDNYPGGRHSKYAAHIQHADGAQTLRFTLEDRLDTATSDTDVNALLLLIDSNSFNADTYVLDNIEILGVGGTPPSNQAPSASFTEQCTDLSCAFTDTSSDGDGSIASVEWDFGDGNQSTQSNPSHTYAVAGDYTVTLTVTDNDGATDQTSQIVTVSSNTGGEATSTVISSVLTGTASAGRGKKYGTATVTVTDDLGNPVQGVTVIGDFSGSWNESASGVTDASGTVVLQTGTTLSGGVSVSFCVTDVTGGLPLDTSSGLCSQ